MNKDKITHVLHVVGGMNRGGVETWLMNVLRHIDRSQVQMDFLVHTADECAYDKEIQALGSKVIPCLHPSQPWRYAYNFRHVLKKYGPYNIVHSHVYWFSGFVIWLAHLAGIPQKIAHIYPAKDKQNPSLSRRAYRWLMASQINKHATGILTDSQETLNAFTQACKCTRQPKEVIYPVVDLSQFKRVIDRQQVRQNLGLPNDLPIVLYVARFAPHKNHKGLLKIAQMVNEKGTMAYFVMAGSHGSLLSELLEIVQSRSDVSILTNIEDISELMLASDVFVFPSLNEGFGIVALEAQAAGLPVIATNLPSIKETLTPSLRALMFEPNALDEAASNITKVLSDTTYRKELAYAGREWTHNFDFEAMVTTLVNFYQRSLTG